VVAANAAKAQLKAVGLTGNTINLAKGANAQANLGSALAQTGRLLEAKSHFERALAIDTNHQLARENLQELQQEMNSH
jgi:tetratricopeptide (TPR) repeat protein